MKFAKAPLGPIARLSLWGPRGDPHRISVQQSRIVIAAGSPSSPRVKVDVEVVVFEGIILVWWCFCLSCCCILLLSVFTSLSDLTEYGDVIGSKVIGHFRCLLKSERQVTSYLRSFICCLAAFFF